VQPFRDRLAPGGDKFPGSVQLPACDAFLLADPFPLWKSSTLVLLAVDAQLELADKILHAGSQVASASP
jgi:hypothetical protein